MKDTRLQQALAALDDARTSLHDMLGELPVSSFDRTPIARAYDETNRAIELVKSVMK